MGDHRSNQEAIKLLEDGWFFTNLLKSKSKILRSNSDPSTKNASQTRSVLQKAPSLPPRFAVEDKEDKYGPRMGDLIRDAMPCSKLTRRSSLDASLLMPQKHSSSKGMKDALSQPAAISRSLQQRRSDELINRNLKRSISLKNLSDKEVQGFQDLGFTFNEEDLSPSVVDKLARFHIKEEAKQEGEVMSRKVSFGNRKLSLSEAWNATQTQRGYSPPIPNLVHTKSSAEDMKEQIKFWAKSVASNVN